MPSCPSGTPSRDLDFLDISPTTQTKRQVHQEIIQDGTPTCEMLSLLQEQGAYHSSSSAKRSFGGDGGILHHDRHSAVLAEPSLNSRLFPRSKCASSHRMIKLLTLYLFSHTQSPGSTVVYPTLRSESSISAESVQMSTSSLSASTWFPTSTNN